MSTLENCDKKTYPAGHLLIKDGEVGECGYLMEDGEVEVFIIDAAGNEQVLSTISGANKIIGEMALLSIDGTRCANVRTTKKSTMLTIPAEEFENLMNCNTKTRNAVLKMISERLKSTNARLREIITGKQSVEF